MAEYRTIRNAANGEMVLERARWCVSFWCHFRGLQFVFNLPDQQGLLFVNDGESRAGAAIHMFFMFMSIGVIWLDQQGKVVDKKLAKPWRPMYSPQAPAMYYIEARPSILERVNVGDQLDFNEVVA